MLIDVLLSMLAGAALGGVVWWKITGGGRHRRPLARRLTDALTVPAAQGGGERVPYAQLTPLERRCELAIRRLRVYQWHGVDWAYPPGTATP